MVTPFAYGGTARTITLYGAMIALGAVLFSALRIPMSQLSAIFAMVAIVVYGLGTRFRLRVSSGGASVSFSDCLVLMVVFLFDGTSAIVLASVAALVATLHFTRRAGTLALNSAIAAIAAFGALSILKLKVGPITGLPQSGVSDALVCATGLLALGLSVVHSGAFRSHRAEEDGTEKVRDRILDGLRVFVTFFVVSAGAGAFARIAGAARLDPEATVVTLAGLVFLAFCEYLKKLYAAAAPQALREDPAAPPVLGRAELFRRTFGHATIGVAIVSPTGQWLQVNRSLCELLGYSEAELLESSFQDMMHPDELGMALANVKQLLDRKIQTYQMEKRYFRKDGEIVWVLWNVALFQDEQSESANLIFQLQEITDRKRSEERLMHDAFHDPLTGLPNRALFIDHLKLAIARTQRSADEIFAVLFLDLDRFKVINDSLGHGCGDELLVGIARRLESCMRLGDTVARVGGDEFTILLEDLKDEAEAILVAERLQKEISAPFNLDGREVFTSVSIGIAPGSRDYQLSEEVLRDADTAMYRAKSRGKARYELFDKAMHTIAVNLLQLETDMRQALKNEEFFVQYQPIVSLTNFKLRGFEALVRWQHPSRGLVSPLDFISIAEETGQIVSIGNWILRASCLEMAEWQRRFPNDPPLCISVNLSGRQFAQPDLIEQVKSVLVESGLSPRSLKLEITESVVMENIEMATAMFKRLRDLGVQLSIDDFGTGYSSLSYLHRFPIDTLKIDRSFVIQMMNNKENIEIVRTIIMLAHNLGMDVVAEGVETKEQLRLLRDLKCELGQGYFFSRPLSSNGARDFLSDLAPKALGHGGESPEHARAIQVVRT